MRKGNKRMLGSEKRNLCVRSLRKEQSTNWKPGLPNKTGKPEAPSKILLQSITITTTVTWSLLINPTIAIWVEAPAQWTQLKCSSLLPSWKRSSSWPKERWDNSEETGSTQATETDLAISTNYWSKTELLTINKTVPCATLEGAVARQIRQVEVRTGSIITLIREEVPLRLVQPSRRKERSSMRAAIPTMAK